MLVRFWGTRGSIPAPGSSTTRYGGNTSCVELRTDDGTVIVLDCGTGARELGLRLLQERPLRIHLLVTHTHWDHIQGFPFFTPAFVPESEITVYAPTGFALDLGQSLAGQMQYTYFPVKLDDLRSHLHLLNVEEGVFQIGNVTVETQYLNHTCPTIGYRITSGGVTVIYATDHEPFTVPPGSLTHPTHAGDRRHISFLEGADLVIHDSQYDEDEYPSKLGWGHSTATYAADVAMEAGARRLALFHHDPMHDDASVARLEAATQTRVLTRRSSLEVFAAAEGLEVQLPEQRGKRAIVTAPSALARHPVSRATILIVSGNRAHTGPITEILQHEGMNTFVASDAEKAVARVRRSRPDAVILDGGFLGPEAYSLAASLSADFESLGMALVLLSPSLDDETIRRAHAAGITDCLAIPFGAPMLHARLKAWLTRNYRRDRRRASDMSEDAKEQLDSTSARKAAILRSTHLFGVVNESDIHLLARRARYRLFRSGSTIVEQGVGGGNLFVIVAGRVRVVGRSPEAQGNEVLLEELGPGDIFGELSTLDDLPHSGTVRAVTQARCLAIRRRDLLGVIERSPAFNLRLLRTLTHRLRQTDRRLVRGGPDALTGLSIRPTVDESYKREAAITRRRGYQLAILLVDVNDLAAINEAEGYAVGDEVLRAVADALRSSTRESDIVARLGGDKFAAILPDAGVDGARLVAARVNRELAGLVSDRSLPTRVGCNIRIASTQTPPGTLEEWLAQVERGGDLWHQRASGSA